MKFVLPPTLLTFEVQDEYGAPVLQGQVDIVEAYKASLPEESEASLPPHQILDGMVRRLQAFMASKGFDLEYGRCSVLLKGLQDGYELFKKKLQPLPTLQNSTESTQPDSETGK